MSGIIAVGHKHIVSVLNTQEKYHIPANPEQPNPVLCCCGSPNPFEGTIKVSQVTLIPRPSLLPALLRQYILVPVTNSLRLHSPTTSTMHCACRLALKKTRGCSATLSSYSRWHCTAMESHRNSCPHLK